MSIMREEAPFLTEGFIKVNEYDFCIFPAGIMEGSIFL
jgi:hypothetical protein